MTIAVRGAAVTDAAAIARLMSQLGYPATEDDIRRRLGYSLRDRVWPLADAALVLALARPVGQPLVKAAVVAPRYEEPNP
jgi:hypothetical protein